MKTKRKKKTKISHRRGQRRQAKKSNSYLATALMVLLLLVMIAFSLGPQAWETSAYETLNLHESISESFSILNAFLAPIGIAVSDVNQFYQSAATEVMYLLDLSETNTGEELTFFVRGTLEFYDSASIEMAALLDFSEISEWPSRVAGVSIER